MRHVTHIWYDLGCLWWVPPIYMKVFDWLWQCSTGRQTWHLAMRLWYLREDVDHWLAPIEKGIWAYLDHQSEVSITVVGIWHVNMILTRRICKAYKINLGCPSDIWWQLRVIDLGMGGKKWLTNKQCYMDVILTRSTFSLVCVTQFQDIYMCIWWVPHVHVVVLDCL
jgi:hypothetical protein